VTFTAEVLRYEKQFKGESMALALAQSSPVPPGGTAVYGTKERGFCNSIADPDDQIVTAALAGSPEAFEVLYRQYQPRIFPIAYRLLGNHEEAEDVTQQAFTSAYMHLRRFDRRARFSTWLTRIVINKSLSRLRAKRRVAPLTEEHSDLDEISHSLKLKELSPTPEERCIQNDLKEQLRRAIAGLKPHLRVVIEMQVFGEMDLRATAQVLGLTEPAVKARLFRARSMLRKILKTSPKKSIGRMMHHPARSKSHTRSVPERAVRVQPWNHSRMSAGQI
jgi:RNA polymerase sigma-70 factor, ECF subfamily